MSSIEIPFAIGDAVWTISRAPHEERVTCPQCAGTRVATLTLGNGEVLTVDCEHCKAGCYPPRGTVKCLTWEIHPEIFVCQDVRVDSSGIGYFDGHRYVEASRLYATREACEVACEVERVTVVAQEERQALHNLTHGRQKMASSAAYWYAQRRKLREDLARIEKYLAAAKAAKP